MRIGAFAKQNNINIETIRYYMDLGLLVPVKKGGHYDFGSVCQDSLDQVISLKEMGFTLQEIRSMFLFGALSRLHSGEEKAYYRSYFKKNLDRIEGELKRLKAAKQLVLNTLNTSNEEDSAEQSVIGIPLRVLPMLVCPKCKGDLMLRSGQVTDNKILEGTLGCSCGMSYDVKNGILMIDPILEEMDFSDDGDMRVEYFETTSKEYIEKIYIAGRWMENALEDWTQPSIILEPGVGSGYALGQSLHAIPQGSVYFAVDHNMNRLNEIRTYFSKSALNFDLVLIGADFMSIPLRDKSIEVIMDMSGSSNRAFDSDQFLIKDLEPLLQEQASLYGLYILADGIDGNEIPFENHTLFQKTPILEALKALNFNILADFETDKVEEGGPHEEFIDFVKSTWTLCCYAKRNM